MRLAKVGDYWRKTYKRDYKFKTSKLEFINLKGLGSGSLEFQGGITAICGLNGVGKSTILSALVGLINEGNNDKTPLINIKLDGAELQLAITTDSNEVISIDYKDGVSNYISGNSEEVEIIWIDISAKGPELLNYFSTVKNLKEHLETVEPYILKEKDLESISYVVGRKYDSCLIYELEIEGNEIPYFEVTINGIKYGTEGMGLGELSGIYIFYCLNRASNNSILIIDEPENYLAHNSQKALIDLIAKYCSEKSIWSIISTHSFNVLNKIPSKYVKLLSRVGNNVKILTYESQESYFEALGMPSKKKGVIFVEDRAAREFSKLWVNYFSPHLANKFEFKDVGSVNEMKKCLNFPELGNWIKIVGVFDGDQRGKVKEKDLNWPFSFLPSDVAPEELLREVATSHINEVADKLNTKTDLLHMILGSIEGLNHHDWLEEFQKKIGFDYNQLIKVLFDIFILNEEEMAKSSFESLSRLLEK